MDITESMLEEATENLHCAMQNLLDNGFNREDYGECVRWSNACSDLIDGLADAS